MIDTVIHGDALATLKGFPDNYVDSIVCDPPAGINFMGKDFDKDRGGRDQWIAWLKEIMVEAMRVLSHGGHALVWALPRTSHWTATALEDAGFEVRDAIFHHFGSGFPKSTAIDKQIDKMLGKEREVIGPSPNWRPAKTHGGAGFDKLGNGEATINITAPATPEAAQWAGYGTALKPSTEIWWLVRKPLAENSIAANVLAWNCGALNIDACRVGNESVETHHSKMLQYHGENSRPYQENMQDSYTQHQGRWPSHLLLSHSVFCQPASCEPDLCPIAEIDRQSGVRKSGGGDKSSNKSPAPGVAYRITHTQPYECEPSTGFASRYFTNFPPDDYIPFGYFSKASRAERNRGCEELPEQSPWTSFDGQYAHGRNPITGERSEQEYKREQSNHHPTVKSLALMRWLIRLITPPGGTVLDCFAGSGSTLVAAIQEGMHFIGVEQDESYTRIANARIAHAWSEQGIFQEAAI